MAIDASGAVCYALFHKQMSHVHYIETRGLSQTRCGEQTVGQGA